MNKSAIIFFKMFFVLSFFILASSVISCEKKEEVVASTKLENEQDTEKEEAKEGEEKEGEAKEEEVKELPPPTAKEIGYAYGAILAKAVLMNHLEIDISAVYKGLKDNIGVNDIDMMKYERILRRAFTEGKIKYATENLEKQTAFLEENKTKEDIHALESGLQYKVLKTGDKNSKQPEKTSKVKIVYEGKALGQENNFDSSNGKEVELSLENVIEGWKEVVPMMHIGDEFEVYIPANLGYGENGINYQRQEIIPPNALLIFKIELKEIVESENEADKSTEGDTIVDTPLPSEK